MSGYKFISILLLTLMILPVGFAAAANSQGLAWGIEEGSSLTYTFAENENLGNEIIVNTDINYKDENLPTFSEDVIFTFDDLPTVPNSFDSENLLTITDFDITLELINVTAFNETYNRTVYYAYDFTLSSPYALPVGNWALFSDLYTEVATDAQESELYESFDFTLLDTADIWGYTLGSRPESSDPNIESNYIEIHYSKTDGALNYIKSWAVRETTQNYTIFEFTREGYVITDMGVDPMVVVVGVMVILAVIIIVSIVIVKKS